MVTKKMTIKIPTGLEARPVAVLVQVASQFESSIHIECGDKKVNAESIMGMMSLGLDAGEEVILPGTPPNPSLINCLSDQPAQYPVSIDKS